MWLSTLLLYIHNIKLVMLQISTLFGRVVVVCGAPLHENTIYIPRKTIFFFTMSLKLRKGILVAVKAQNSRGKRYTYSEGGKKRRYSDEEDAQDGRKWRRNSSNSKDNSNN